MGELHIVCIHHTHEESYSYTSCQRDRYPKDASSVWRPLYDARVDLINTDNLPGLSQYIQSRRNTTVPESSSTVALVGVLGISVLLQSLKRSKVKS